jgi:hypothetical protein
MSRNKDCRKTGWDPETVRTKFLSLSLEGQCSFGGFHWAVLRIELSGQPYQNVRELRFKALDDR